mmetsp:Transcript_42857/g.50254  ORF Transcript_42857/g.50254 Transcript_42857/m.50254 type:complete len:139 (-) Transcript_42857:33-449(-)
MNQPKETISSQEPCEELSKTTSPLKIVRIKTMNFKKELTRLVKTIDNISDDDRVVFKGCRKGVNRINESMKKSLYIGVTKNGPHWQTLITINERKTYLGTFVEQEVAARVLKARPNFKYTKSEAQALISRCRHLVKLN